ncbi:Ig-like domain-containing protein [Variovorax boronicumulans]|uniref:Ig-like domain-containing protein n=1 Tax=Variovorax boronicumulans TaxID=436515 RepID=UPI0007855BC8|nr:Ig-like domain-containing protein [Variovorax boronicumulans]
MALEQTNSVAPFQNIDLASTFAPPPPYVGSAADDAGDILGSIAPGGVTDDRQPTFQGQGTPGDTIVIRDNGTEIGTTEVDANGTWTFTPSTDLLEGQHAITIVTRDDSGNEGTPSPAFNFEIDVTPPDASRLAVTGVADAVGGVTGNVAPGGTTDDTRPLLSGNSTGVPGHTVTVMVRDATGTRELGQATIGENGQWTFQVDAPLAAGPNTFTLVERDAAGNETMPTGRYTVTVNTDKPNAPVIDSVFDDVGEPHMLQQGEATNDARPTLAGTAQANHTVKFHDGSTFLGQVVADASGKWSFTPEIDLTDGAHGITATSTSPVGQTSEASGSWNFVVDTAPPAKPTIVSVVDDVGPVTGNVSKDGFTNDTRPALSGKAEADSTVVIHDNGVELTKVTANASGDWTYTPATALGQGGHSITVTAVDKAGNTSVESDAFGFTVDTVAPTATATVSSIGKDSGFSDVDYLTNDGSAGRLMRGSLSASLAASEALQVSTDGGKTWKTAFVSGTQWSAQDDSSHTGDWAVQRRVVDAAGNVGTVKSQAISLDTVAPSAPTSVVMDGLSGVNISFDKTNAKAGDRIHVTTSDRQFDYQLTTADIAAGKATINDPSIAVSQRITAALVDQAGNSSVTASFEIISTTEKFNHARQINIPKLETNFGSVVRESGHLSVGGYFNHSYPNAGNLYIGRTNGAAVAVTNYDVIRFDLNRPANKVIINVAYDNAGANYFEFYDSTGSALGKTFVTTDSGSHEHTFTSSSGKSISYFKYFAMGEINGINIERITVEYSQSALGNSDVDVTRNDGYLGSASTDTFVLRDAGVLQNFSGYIKGNGGTDTLKLTGANQTLDLTTLAGKVSSVEVIDITGTGNNTLKLSLADVMENGAMNQFVSDGRVQMMVKGNAGDKVTLTDVLPNGTDPGDWVKKANVTVGGVVYEVYQHSGFDAELLVQQGVTVTLQNTGAGTFHISPEAEVHVLDHATQVYTDNDDTLIARLGFADRLAGAAGNDSLLNVGSADVAHGGAGNDVIHVLSGDFERVDGGLGIDTLAMDGKAMHIDLSALGAKVQGFEKFDLGAGGNTLALHADDVLARGMRGMVTADGKVQMLVSGANGDVNLLGGNDSWTQGDSATVSGVTYIVYTNLAGTAELLVEDKVHVTIL